MQNNTKYFLPKNYHANPCVSFDKTPKDNYWDNNRIKSSQSYQQAVYDWADKIIKKNNIKSVVDIGCGYADKLALLHKKNPKISFTGMDQPSIIKICNKHHRFGNWIACNLEDDLSINQKYDLIISSDVIEHLHNPDYLLNLIKKLAHSESLILISTPERDLARGKDNLQSPNSHHVREWNKKEFIAYLEYNDFAIQNHKILSALSFKFAYFYFYHILKRLKNFKGWHYNQAILAKIKPIKN